MLAKRFQRIIVGNLPEIKHLVLKDEFLETLTNVARYCEHIIQ